MKKLENIPGGIISVSAPAERGKWKVHFQMDASMTGKSVAVDIMTFLC